MLKQNQNACTHQNIGKEVICGTKTGDYICYDCGETFAEKLKKNDKYTHMNGSD